MTKTDSGKWERSSMRLHTNGGDIGSFVLKLKRGKKVWHDDGAQGYTRVLKEGAEVKTEVFRTTAEQRDEVLRRLHDIFVRTQNSQSE